MAYEKVTLYGVPIVAAARSTTGGSTRSCRRELFIRHALVEGDWQTHHAFFADNRRLLDEVEELENRARRRDILVDDETLFDFYDQRIPADVVSGRHFDSWWKKARREQPDLLTFTRDCWSTTARRGRPRTTTRTSGRPTGVRAAADLPVRAGHADADGVTVHIPLPLLNQVAADGFDWQVPGLREELVTALIRSLPKALRRNFVPVPDYARAAPRPRSRPARSRCWTRSTPGAAPADRGDGAARRLGPDKVPTTCGSPSGWSTTTSKPVAEGKDLRRRCNASSRRRYAQVVGGRRAELERTGLRTWSIGTLPRTRRAGPRRLRGHRLPGAGRRGRTWRCGCSTPRPSSGARTGPAPAGCCCSPCRPRPGSCRGGWPTRPSWR